MSKQEVGEEVENDVAEDQKDVAKATEAARAKPSDPEIDPNTALAAFYEMIRTKLFDNQDAVTNGLMENVKKGHFPSFMAVLKMAMEATALRSAPAVEERSFASWLWDEFSKTANRE